MPEREEAAQPKREKVFLRLYVAGHSNNGTIALRNITRFCEIWLHGSYELRVIDVLKEPHLASQDAIVATPTLVKHAPGKARLFGTLTDMEKLRAVIGESEGKPGPAVRALV